MPLQMNIAAIAAGRVRAAGGKSPSATDSPNFLCALIDGGRSLQNRAVSATAATSLRKSAKGAVRTTAPFEIQRATGPAAVCQTSKTNMLANGGQKGGSLRRPKAAHSGSIGPVSWPLQNMNR